MSKFIAVLVLILVCAAAAKSTKRSSNKYAKNAYAYAGSMASQITEERVAAVAKWKKLSAKCKTTIAEHKGHMVSSHMAARASRSTIRSCESGIKSNERNVESLEKFIKSERRRLARLDKEFIENDKKRVLAKKRHQEKIEALDQQIRFVRRLYARVMGSSVERRRTVSFIELGSDDHQKLTSIAKTHSLNADSFVSVMNQALATKNHVDKMYEEMDNLRADLQKSKRALQRVFRIATKNFRIKQAHLRTTQLKTHQRINKTMNTMDDLKITIAKLNRKIGRNRIKMESANVENVNHTRDYKVTKAHCLAAAARYKRTMKTLESEAKTMQVFKGKLSGYYSKVNGKARGL